MLRSKIRSHADLFHFDAILFLLIALSFISIYYVILLIFYFIFLLRKKLFNKYLFIFSILFLSLFIYKRYEKTHLNINDETISGIVINIKDYDNYSKVVVSKGYERVNVYISDTSNLSIGDKVLFEGSFSEIKTDSLNNTLNYYKASNTFISFNAKEYEIKGKSIYSLKHKIVSFYETKLEEDSFNYFKSLIFLYDLDSDLKEDSAKIGISYLFAISGFHLLFLYKILNFLLKKMNEKYRDIFIMQLLFIYILLLNFSVSLLRAYLMMLLGILNKRKGLILQSLDILSISFILMIFINPYRIYLASFNLSFLATLTIILSSDLLKGFKGIKKSYLVSLLCYLITIPLVINMNYEINLLTILLSPIFLAIFSYLIMPLIYLMIPFFIIVFPFNFIFSFLKKLIEWLTNIEIFSFQVHELSHLEIIIYFFLFFYLLISFENRKKIKKALVFFLVFFVFLINQISFNPYSKIEMLDCGQGDSILVSSKGSNLLIDSYNNIDLLKKEGIKKIDTIVITHSDNDHIQSCKEVILKYKVSTLISSYYDNSTELNELKKLVKNNLALREGDYYKLNEINMDVILPKNYHNSLNNNSLVFILKIKQTKMLFTGDMEELEEKDLSQKLNVDILKVAHHGSDSSTSKYFLDKVKFKDALISVGAYNNYNHPSNLVLKRLEGKNVYMTKDSSNIKILIKKDGYFIVTKKQLQYFW